MSEEQQRVVRMLKAGRVTVEEAEALLEALGEEQEEKVRPPETAAVQDAAGASARAEAGPAPTAPPEEPVTERRRDFHRMIDDILTSVDVDGIMETMRESLHRSKVDVDRLKDEVWRAAKSARDEGRRAAHEYRRRGFGMRVSRAIEGLWGLTDAEGTWAYDGELAAGQTLSIYNVWGDVTLSLSQDSQVHVHAATRAWGRDGVEAAALRDDIRITAVDEGRTFAIRVESRLGDLPRRFRADFTVSVPAGVGVEVVQAKGDVSATGLSGPLTFPVVKGDITVRDHTGAVHVDTAKGDVNIERVTGDVRVRSKHGDITLADIDGRAEVSVLSGDISAANVKEAVDLRTLRGDVAMEGLAGRIVASSKNGDLSLKHPAGAVSLEFQTARGDVVGEVEQFVAGSTSVMSTMSGDVSIRLGEDTRCRLSARVTAGDIQINGSVQETQRSRRSLEGVIGGADASLELSTVSGDVVIDARRVDLG
ncbi:MAG: DUF4097 family beta strand repeat-containing protein, partial [Armatimonadota bacterium]